MPSPLGHALGGLAAGWLASSNSPASRRWTRVACFAAAGMAADLDLIVGLHSGPSHSVGATILIGAATFLIRRQVRFAAALAAAYGSHILLDWLGSDAAPPIGIMALWPFTREYYESSVHLFHAISRRYWLPDFWSLNVRAVLRELIVLLPVTVVVGLLRGVFRLTRREPRRRRKADAR